MRPAHPYVRARTVCSNADEVELRLNGRSLGRRRTQLPSAV
ncbi:DUF4982 domain-containing protein [Streptomyces sp. NPDC090088]